MYMYMYMYSVQCTYQFVHSSSTHLLGNDHCRRVVEERGREGGRERKGGKGREREGKGGKGREREGKGGRGRGGRRYTCIPSKVSYIRYMYMYVYTSKKTLDAPQST